MMTLAEISDAHSHNDSSSGDPERPSNNYWESSVKGQKAQPRRGDRVNFRGLAKVCEIHHLAPVNACIKSIYPEVGEIVRSGSTERQTSWSRLKEAAARSSNSQDVQTGKFLRHIHSIPSPEMDGLIHWQYKVLIAPWWREAVQATHPALST